MVAIRICDVCKSEGKIAEATSFSSIRKRPDLRLDTCKTHYGIAPNASTEYEKFVRKIKGWD